MPRRGWRREGARRPFRYADARGVRIRDRATIERLDALAIPPAWRDVWISPNVNAKLQATGIDAAGRKQYLYHPDFRAQRDGEKFDKLIRFAEKLPELRAAMGEHMTLDPLDPLRVCAVALRVINLGWFRNVRGDRVTFRFAAKGRAQVRTALVDAELSESIRELLATRGRRLFRYDADGKLVNLTDRRLNEYIKEHIGEDFSGKDFRTWGGTLLAAIAFAERGPVEGKAEEKRVVSAVMRHVAYKLGNTPAVCRASYVSPAVVEQYLERRTIEDFRPSHLRIVSARNIDLDPEEQATLSLLRSHRIRRARRAA